MEPNPSYRWLWSAAAVSNYGSMLHAIALPFVAITVLDASPAEIALLSAAGLLPGFALGLVASTWIDRWPRRTLLVAGDVLRAVAVLWIPTAAWLDVLTFGQLYAFAAVHGLLTFVFEVAHQAILPSVVPTGELVEANGQLRAAGAVTEGAAFASGGWLVQWLTAPLVLLVDSASFLVSALCLRGVRLEPGASDPPLPRRSRPPGGFLRETLSGLETVAGSPLLRPITAAGVLANTGWRIAGTVYLLYVYEELGFSPGTLGFVFAVGAVASFVGALVTPRLAAAVGSGPSVAVGLFFFGLSMWILPLAPGAGAFSLLILVAHQLGDGFEVVAEVNAASLRQRIAPEAVLGRVTGAGSFASSGAMLVGLGVGGWLGETIGLRATLFVAGCVPVAGAVYAALSPLRHES